MFTKREPRNPQLDKLISDLYFELRGYDAHSEEYERTAVQLSKMLKLKLEIEPTTSVNPDVLFSGAVNLLGILAILQYERVHVVTSKAVSFVMKLR